MNRIVVREKGQAKRCEVCHQADLFDSVSELCERCRFLTEKPYAVWDLLVPARKWVSGVLFLVYFGNLIFFDKTVLLISYFCLIGLLPFACCGLLIFLVYSSKEVKL
jgi:hypothetical protein